MCLLMSLLAVASAGEATFDFKVSLPDSGHRGGRGRLRIPTVDALARDEALADELVRCVKYPVATVPVSHSFGVASLRRHRADWRCRGWPVFFWKRDRSKLQITARNCLVLAAFRRALGQGRAGGRMFPRVDRRHPTPVFDGLPIFGMEMLQTAPNLHRIAPFLECRLLANPHGCSLRAQACHAGIPAESIYSNAAGRQVASTASGRLWGFAHRSHEPKASSNLASAADCSANVFELAFCSRPAYEASTERRAALAREGSSAATSRVVRYQRAQESSRPPRSSSLVLKAPAAGCIRV